MDDNSYRQFVLRPNSSLTPQQALIFFAAISINSIIIGIVFASLGCWFVLPFSGGELVLLGLCLYSSLRRSEVCEVITVTKSKVRVERGSKTPEQAFEFRRCLTNVEVVKSTVRGHPSRLAIRCLDRRIEVGHFLIESERGRLALELKPLIGLVRG